MKTIRWLLIAVAALVVVGAAFIYSGMFNVAADDAHWSMTARLIEATREHSIDAQSRSVLTSPSLEDPDLIAMGAAHYDEMCTGCHLGPGLEDSELRAGLYPQPPKLAEHTEHRTPAELFWIIKHGLKMTGMPAWGMSHDDRSIWGMVAFVQKLPQLSPTAYHELVGKGGSGHHHAEDGDNPEGNSAHAHDENAEQGEHSHGPGDGAADGASGGAHVHSQSAKSAPVSQIAVAAAEPVSVVEQFFHSLASGDTRTATHLLDPAVLIYESGGVERSRAEYVGHHLESDAQFLKSAKQELLSRTGDAVGDVAWVASEAKLTSNAQGKAVNLVTTETMVLRKSQDGWRIVHIHWSNRTAPISTAREVGHAH